MLVYDSETTQERPYPNYYSILSLLLVQNTHPAGLNLRIHTPQFYRQLTTYGKLSDFLSYTLLHPYEENRTGWSDEAQSFVAAIQKFEMAESSQEPTQKPRLRATGIIWAIYRGLRLIQPMKGVYPDPGFPATRMDVKPQAQSKSPAPKSGLCFLDDFVFTNCNFILQVRYILAIVRIQWRARVMGIVGGE